MAARSAAGGSVVRAVRCGRGLGRPRRVSVGDKVYAPPFDRDGVAAEYAAVAAQVLAPKPASLSHVESAAVPLPALSGRHCSCTAVSQPAKVLVQGSVGGVGRFATQLGRWRGAHVIATARPDAFQAARALGAHEVVDGRSGQFDDELEAVDVIFDTVAASSWPARPRYLRGAAVSSRSPRAAGGRDLLRS